MTEIFISYAHDDKERVYEIWAKMRLHYDAWIDNRIPAGSDWWDTILTHIEECEYFLYVISPSSVTSIYCDAELNYALALNKPVLPLVLQEANYPDSLNKKRVQFKHISENMSLEAILFNISEGLRKIDKDSSKGKYQEKSAPRPSLPTKTDTTDDELSDLSSAVSGILPPPFKWIDIPAGQVTLRSGGYLSQPTTFDVAPFRIAKYPVTNAQYAKFIEAGGYDNPDYWTEAGWQTRQEKGWSEPGYWQVSKFNGSDQPVNGVSWYEASAFTRWLSKQTRKNITLPTEQQWQRAAQGDDNRVYPWGNEWKNNAANVNSQSTTPVTKYQYSGDSPYGVVDMIGNVWEWCLTGWDSGNDQEDTSKRHILRGGCFHRYRRYALCAYRYYHYADGQHGSCGLRLVYNYPVQS